MECHRLKNVYKFIFEREKTSKINILIIAEIVQQDISVNCTFEKWNCTYSSPDESIRKWERTETREGKKIDLSKIPSGIRNSMRSKYYF